MRFRRDVRGPVLGPTAKIVAAVAVIPFLLLTLGVIGYEVWLALDGRPSEVIPAFGGFAFWFVFLVLPILGALWLGAARLSSADAALRTRVRGRPRVPKSVAVTRHVAALGAEQAGLPLFDRPLAHLWSTVAIVETDGAELEVFELVHGDLRGEGGRSSGYAFGLSLLTCAAFRIDGDVPQVVVRPAGSKRFSLPDGMVRHATELHDFNESHRLLSADPYAASVLVDPRTIEAIRDFDPRFALEIGGAWVVVYAPRLKPKDVARLIEATAELARTFPRVAASIYPTANRT